MSEGWIKVHRKLLDSPTFDNEKILKVWMWTLLKANHRKQQIVLGYQKVTLNPGEFVYGRFSAAEELKMSASTVRNCLAKLSEFGNLDIKSTNKFSIVKIKGWNLYQGDGQQNNNKITSNGQQNATDNNVKNDKNVKNIDGGLSLTELIESFKGKYSPSMIQDFLLYWDEIDHNGKPLWKKQRTWETDKRLIKWQKNRERWDYERSQKQQLKKIDEAPVHRLPVNERIDTGFTAIGNFFTQTNE